MRKNDPYMDPEKRKDWRKIQKLKLAGEWPPKKKKSKKKIMNKKSKNKTGKSGRPPKMIPFEEARKFVREQNIGSIKQYKTWWILEKPVNIPKRPDRTYDGKGFTTWNDFLGNNNKFGSGQVGCGGYRRFNEAKAYAQSLGISKRQEWFDLFDNDEIPKNIPKRPDLYYREENEWNTWGEFLGVNPLSKTETVQQNETIFFIIINPRAEQNYYKCSLTTGGISSINDFLVKINGRLIVAYYVPNEFNVKEFMSEFNSEEHWDHKEYYFISNVTPILSKLSFNYQKVKN